MQNKTSSINSTTQALCKIKNNLRTGAMEKKKGKYKWKSQSWKKKNSKRIGDDREESTWNIHLNRLMCIVQRASSTIQFVYKSWRQVKYFLYSWLLMIFFHFFSFFRSLALSLSSSIPQLLLDAIIHNWLIARQNNWFGNEKKQKRKMK